MVEMDFRTTMELEVYLVNLLTNAGLTSWILVT